MKTVYFLLFFNFALAQNNTVYTYDFTDKPIRKKLLSLNFKFQFHFREMRITEKFYKMEVKTVIGFYLMESMPI